MTLPSVPTLATPRAPTVDAAPAWIVREVTHVPGVLELAAGRLRFRSSRRVVFDVDPVAASAAGTLAVRRRVRSGAVDVVEVTADGERHRVHLHRPRGATAPPPALLADVPAGATIPGAVWDALPAARGPHVGPRPGGVRTSRWRRARARRGCAASTPRP